MLAPSAPQTTSRSSGAAPLARRLRLAAPRLRPAPVPSTAASATCGTFAPPAVRRHRRHRRRPDASGVPAAARRVWPARCAACRAAASGNADNSALRALRLPTSPPNRRCRQRPALALDTLRARCHSRRPVRRRHPGHSTVRRSAARRRATLARRPVASPSPSRNRRRASAAVRACRIGCAPRHPAPSSARRAPSSPAPSTTGALLAGEPADNARDGGAPARSAPGTARAAATAVPARCPEPAPAPAPPRRRRRPRIISALRSTISASPISTRRSRTIGRCSSRTTRAPRSTTTWACSTRSTASATMRCGSFSARSRSIRAMSRRTTISASR